MPSRTNGPLTGRQTSILKFLAHGQRHREIAKRLDVTATVVRQDVSTIVRKMNVGTSAEAVAAWSRAQAYNHAADQIERLGVIRRPIDPAEEHTNHVVLGIANQLRAIARPLLPR